jgi:hypothetical protein
MFLAARFSLGDPGLFLLGSAIVGSVAAIDLVLERLGQTTGRDRLFTLLLAIWLPVFAIIGAAAWGSGKYNGEVVGVLALAVVGFVAIVEPAQIVLPWTVAGALMLTLGAAARGGFSGEELVVALVIVVIATFTGRLRGVIEGYQGRRRAVIHEITKVAVGSDPFETAGAILEPLIKRAPSRLGAFVWFTDDDRSLLLAVAGSSCRRIAMTSYASAPPAGRGWPTGPARARMRWAPMWPGSGPQASHPSPMSRSFTGGCSPASSGSDPGRRAPTA